jgi:hypothetical protein
MPKTTQRDRELPQHIGQWCTSIRQRCISETVDINSPLLARRHIVDAQLHSFKHIAVGCEGAPPKLHHSSEVEVTQRRQSRQGRGHYI